MTSTTEPGDPLGETAGRHLVRRVPKAGPAAVVDAGLLIGLVLGALAFPAVLLGYGDMRLALAVGAAILVAGGIATSVGLVFPWLLMRFGTDPAFGSGPVATIIQDVLSLLTYFLIVTVLL